MRMKRIAAVLLLLVATSAFAADPIRVPAAPVIPQPMPAPTPGPDAAIRLAGEHLYVIDSDVPVIVLASPRGLVSVSEEAGPVKIRGRFVDGLGKVETRTFKGKSVITIEAVGTGRVELLVVPQGATKEADVIRRTIDVDSGTAPIPPPKPDPKPDPKPNPKPDPPAPGAKVFGVVIMDRLNADPAQAAAVGSKVFRDYLAANGHELEIIDTATDAGKRRAETEYKFLAARGVTPPAFVILDATDGARKGQVLLAVKLPATDTGLVDAIKSVTGK